MKQRLPVNALISSSLRIILPVLLLCVLIVLTAYGFVFYRITHPPQYNEPTNPAFYMLESMDVEITSEDGDKIYGWWIPAGKNSAGILLAAGYGMNRSDVLSLAAVLNKRDLNVLVYAQRGSSGSGEKSSSFGLKEKEDMVHAIRFLQSITESDPSRIGIWGVDVQAYASLWAAASIPEVRAIAADNPYSSLNDFIHVRIQEEFDLDSRILHFGCKQIFRLRYVASGSLKEAHIPLELLSDRSFLFITGENREALSKLTAELYDDLSAKKEMISLKESRVRFMEGNDLRDYDTRVADFFEENLQPTGQ